MGLMLGHQEYLNSQSRHSVASLTWQVSPSVLMVQVFTHWVVKIRPVLLQKESTICLCWTSQTLFMLQIGFFSSSSVLSGTPDSLPGFQALEWVIRFSNRGYKAPVASHDLVLSEKECLKISEFSSSKNNLHAQRQWGSLFAYLISYCNA